jgi:cell division control protein 7
VLCVTDVLGIRLGKSETISCWKDKISQSSPSLVPVVHAKEAIVDVRSRPLKRKRSNRSPVGREPKIDNKSRHGSQAADASGVTSAKDPTNTKTSLGKLKQPMLYKGRKELMNFLQETMQNPNEDTLKAPVSQRKRVAAPFGSVDRKIFALTPMPLRSGGSSVAGSGMLNNKGMFS